MAAAAPVNLNDVQGDILVGLPKKVEAYWFIQIDDHRVQEFRVQLSKLVPLVTSSAQAANDQGDCSQHQKNGKLLTLAGVNIGFSKKGLVKIGITEHLSSTPDTDPFEQTMLATAAANFHDRVSGPDATWFEEFRKDIHVLIFITADCRATLDSTFTKVKHIVGKTIKEIKLVTGAVRPGKQKDHEHFGYNDGISQPAVKDIDTSPFPGNIPPHQPIIDQGIILLGRQGDQSLTSRPAWTFDGSFLAFRYLTQLVPEFQKFIDDNNPVGAEPDLLGAQLVGRWKSGTPIVLSPNKDIPDLGSDPQRNNNFDYAPVKSQAQCPFAAHIRKTNPRNDIGDQGVARNRIIRRGISFGPEVTDDEKANKKSEIDRGLLFKCYQSNLVNGFQFIQQSWANNANFPFSKPLRAPGIDAIVGQSPNGGIRELDIKGDDNLPEGKLSLPVEWVISRGGEYFFVPSISVLGSVFARAALPVPGKEL